MNCGFLINSIHIDLDGNVFPCIVSPYADNSSIGSLKTELLESIFNKATANGSSCKPYCNKCIDYKYSFRDWNKSSNKYDLIDLRLDNYCNFLCRTCSGYNSIAFRKEESNVVKLDNTELILKNIDFINKFSRVYISGGEPLMSFNSLKFLKLLTSDKQVMVSTNLSMNIPNEHVKELKRFKEPTIYPSIDGVGEVGKYIRYGFNEEKFFKNIEILKQDFNIVPVITVNSLNVIYLKNIILKLSNYVNINNIYLNFLSNPIELNASVLPKYLKDLAFLKIKEVEKLLDKDFIINAPYNLHKGIVLMKDKMKWDNSGKFNGILDFLKNKDKIRNQSYKTVFPFL